MPTVDRTLPSSPRRPRRGAIVALAAAIGAGIAGCSSTKLAYNHLDWVVNWQLKRYVALEAPQKALFEERFQVFWDWHRSTQLGLYARDLRQLARETEAPVTRDRVGAWLSRAGEHGRHALDEALPTIASTLASMNDGQVAELLENMDEKRRDRIEEDEDLTDEEFAEKSAGRMIKGARDWLGSVNDAQRARIEAWSHEQQDGREVWRQWSREWGAAFSAVLATREKPGFAQRLRKMFLDPKLPHSAALREISRRNTDAWTALVADLSASLDPDQREFTQGRLRDLAEDFELLAAESGDAPASASPAMRKAPARAPSPKKAAAPGGIG